MEIESSANRAFCYPEIVCSGVICDLQGAACRLVEPS
jgi:hypothetical protein